MANFTGNVNQVVDKEFSAFAITVSHQVMIKKNRGTHAEQVKASREYNVFAAGFQGDNGGVFNPNQYGISAGDKARYEGWYQAGKMARLRMQ